MTKSIGGNNYTKHDKYIIDILASNSNIYVYEAPLIVRAFKKTVKYFFDNLIEFKINDVFEFIKFHKKEIQLYVVYKKDFKTIPEHDDMKIKITKKLKDYLNGRNEFKDVRHREKLPDGSVRVNKFF